jgi:hypothetical protein
MKEKSVFDNFLGEHDNSILLNKLKIHDELKDTIINNNIVKIMNLEKILQEETKNKEDIKKKNIELQMNLANKLLNKPLVDNLNTSKKSSVINRSDYGSDNEMSITLVNDKKKDTKRSYNNHSVDEEAFSRKRGNNTPIRSSQRSSNENIYSSQKIKLVKSNDIKKTKISTSSFNNNKVITKKETPPASKITLKKVNTGSVSKTNVIQISKVNYFFI